MKQIFSIFVTLFAITTPAFSLQKHKVEKDEAKITQLQDANFFNKIYIEGHNYLVLVIPDECKECSGLMKEFTKSKQNIAEEFPDGTIGYIYGQTKANFLVRKALEINHTPTSLVAKAWIQNRLFTYEGNLIHLMNHSFHV